jgi:hypothetical protein
MNLLRKVVTSLGSITLAALLLAALAPKATRGVAAALVQVTNTASNAVPTEDGPGNFPFAATSCAEVIRTACGTVSPLTVPLTTSTGSAVKRLVIEDVELDCDLDPGASSILGLMRVPLPADTAQSGLSFLLYNLSTTPLATSFAFAHTPVRIYADPGAELVTTISGIFGSPGSPAGATCFISLSGHLETK